jgi:ATP-binding cassette subfamily B multidrug efflux pump
MTVVSDSVKIKKKNRRSRQNDWRLFLKLLPYLGRHKRSLLSALCFLIPLSIAGAIQPLIIGQAISLLRGEKTWFFLNNLPLERGLNILISLMLGTILTRLAFSATQGFIIQKIGQKITAQIRQDLFTHVTSLSSRFFDRTPVGKLVTRMTSDVEALGDVFATGAIGVVSDAVYILSILVTIFTVEWRLASILVVILIPVSFLIVYFQRQYREANYQGREEISKLNSILQENIAGINVVQLFRRERFNAEMFRSINDRYRQALDRTIFHESAISATLEWISIVAIAAMLWLGGGLVLQNNLNFGTLSAFILYAQILFNPIKQFADKFTTFQSGFTAIERISELMDEPIDIRDREFSERELALSVLKPKNERLGEIRFEKVWFGYKPNEFVIQDLDFTIKPGEKVALVGPTGAGKSSIIRLLCRLYEPSKGRILIDGIDIRDISQAELRRYVGVILQESFLFAGDVNRNISLGDDYSIERIKQSAKLTNVDRFIEELPQDYNTQLRERGTNLSGGQKQLIAFARVAIRNPSILVLDEATSSLDVATESLIQEALDRLLVNRTAIIIAHRLSTIRNVDKILVLKQGQLVESGTHEDLIEENGLYASLYKLQMLGS